nr:MAG TPA: hypothetical protein [Caudoviricetes sp.]
MRVIRSNLLDFWQLHRLLRFYNFFLLCSHIIFIYNSTKIRFFRPNCLIYAYQSYLYTSKTR